METARIIRVFVSSPGDVAEERGVLDEVVARINRVDGRDRGIRLELFKWEDNVAPQIGPKPQQAVDSQTPAYDIYLGIMSTRFGTPTERFGSGTEEEFRDALQKWQEVGKPWITFYFNDEPKLSHEPKNVKQYLQVCEFREELSKNGIVAKYRGVRGGQDAFYEQVSDHLRMILQRFLQGSLEEPRDAKQQAVPAIPEIPTGYLEWLQEKCADIELGLKDTQGTAVRLNHVYVPLATRIAKEDQGHDPREFERSIRPGEEQKPQLLLDRFAKKSLYVAGAPGSGKSTFCRWLAWLVCTGAMPVQPIAPEEGYSESFPENLGDRLPLLIPLRDFWQVIPAESGGQSLSRPELEQALLRWVDVKRPGELPAECVEGHLRNGSLLLILDGMDEVPISHGDHANQFHPRALLLSGLTHSIGRWIKAGNLVLLTSRPYGISEADAGKLVLDAAPIAELNGTLQELLIRRWFDALMHKPELGAQKAGEMLGHIRGRQELSPLVENPLLLTAMCIIYSQGKRLPKDKHDLYDRILDCVLHNRYFNDEGEISLVRKRLSIIALAMHTGQGLDEDRMTPEAEATYAEVDQVIQRFRDLSPATEPGFKGAVQAREDLLTRSGLLLPKGDKRAGFYHFTFQDFLAAQMLLESNQDLSDLFRKRADKNEWRSTLSFVFSSLMARNTLPDKGIHLLENLIGDVTLDQLGLAVVLADCLEILTGHSFGLQDQHVDMFRKLCLDAIEQQVSLPQRFELGKALGRIGNPRVPSDLRDHDDQRAWIVIPADSFSIGDDPKGYPNPWKPLAPEVFEPQSAFRITRFPVTNGQFRLFVDEGGYDVQSNWSDDGWAWKTSNDVTEPAYWRDAKWNGETQPVVGVSYWEAEAFAHWVGGQLPTERQWEAAVRGPDSNKYAWGNDWKDGICNSTGADLNVTSPVGLFPTSRSQPFGLDDAAGNVWEWCSDLHRSESSARVLRGGAWVNEAASCRSAIRLRDQPDNRYDFVGFRMVDSCQDS